MEAGFLPLVPLRSDELPGKVVECGAQVVENVASDGAQPQRDSLGSEIDRVVTGIRPFIEREGIGVSLLENASAVVQRVEVLPCSINLRPGTC